AGLPGADPSLTLPPVPETCAGYYRSSRPAEYYGDALSSGILRSASVVLRMALGMARLLSSANGPPGPSAHLARRGSPRRRRSAAQATRAGVRRRRGGARWTFPAP